MLAHVKSALGVSIGADWLFFKIASSFGVNLGRNHSDVVKLALIWVVHFVLLCVEGEWGKVVVGSTEFAGEVGNASAGSLHVAEVFIFHVWSDTVFKIFVIKIIKHAIRSHYDDIIVLNFVFIIISMKRRILRIGATLVGEVERELLFLCSEKLFKLAVAQWSDKKVA